MNPPTQTLHIIIADDDEDDQLLFREVVNELKMDTEIVIAETAAHLLVLLEGYLEIPPPHLIFLDINMPGESGMDCLKEIRSSARYANASIIMFSTSMAERDIDLAFSNGADLYLGKDIFYKLPTTRKMELIMNWKKHHEKKCRESFVVQLDSF